MADNPYARQGRERKALAIEHALRGAGVDTHAALERYVLSDDAIRNRAERAAAEALGHTWRQPASDCGTDHTDPELRCCTWGWVQALFRQVDQSRELIGGQS